jgi:hypothetical protein
VILYLETGFRGVTGNEVKLESEIGDCEFRFEKRQRYFVYASRDKVTNTLRTSACTRTKLLSEAAEDLAFAEKVSRGAGDLVILGRALEDQHIPVKNVGVYVRGNDQEYNASTGEDGSFAVPVPAPGRYQVRVVVPHEYTIVGPRHQIEKIARTSEKDGQITVEYDVEVERAKCAFVDVPLFPIRGSN